MFTGLIETTGTMTGRTGQSISVKPDLPEFLGNVKTGDSMALNGVCLTVEALTAAEFSVFLSDETLRLTNLPLLHPGSKVNLEKPLSLDGLLHGHLVQGHTDGTGVVEDLFRRGENWVLKVRYDPRLDPYMVLKGSIAVNGISLTIAAKTGSLFEVAVIPGTMTKTNLSTTRSGDKVNLETDLLAKYVENFVSPGRGKIP